MVTLHLDRVGMRFTTAAGDVEALPRTDLRVDPGEYLAIEGASGSGKSTLLNIIGMLEVATSGKYYVDGQDVSTMSDAERTEMRASVFGFVFQGFHLLDNLNVIDNVALGLAYSGIPRRRRYERALSSLDQLGLAHRLTAQPTTLSGGERQRVAVARAIVGRPSVLLADEPTGNLDRVSTLDMLAIIADLHHEGLTVVVVTHDPVVADASDRRFAMEVTPG